MGRSKLQDDIERWLTHENYSFAESREEGDVFRIVIKGLGTYRMPIEIFEPTKQPGVAVLGYKIFLQNRHTARFLKLNEGEQQKFKNTVGDFCASVGAINKIFREDGKVVVGVYLVLDNVERFTQQIIMDSISKVMEMGEKTNHFIIKTF